MTDLLRRGRLEVETDLLLGVEEVLLLPGVTASSVQTVASTTVGNSVRASAPAVARGFDSALFATGRNSTPPIVVSGSDDGPARRPTPERSVARVADSNVPTGIASISTGVVTEIIAPIVDRIVPPAGSSRADQLTALEQMHASLCAHCNNSAAHRNLVFGEGPADAELVFVGESPNESEDEQGRPFVGRAGEKLDEMIAAMGLARSEVYLANVIKCRPPENHATLALEVDRCGPYLLAQLSIIRPKVIVTLGGPATKLLVASELGITRLRGNFVSLKLGVAQGEPFEVQVMPTFHPAYLLRSYTVETRAQVWEDLKKVLSALGRSLPARK